MAVVFVGVWANDGVKTAASAMTEYWIVSILENTRLSEKSTAKWVADVWHSHI